MLPFPTSMQANKFINIAPKHVLWKILTFVSDDERPDLSLEVPYINCTARPHNAKVYLVTHVCRRLRYEAKNYPYFWSYIHIGNHKAKQINTYLERSREAPLDVESSCKPDDIEKVKQCIDYFLPHVPRIRNVVVKLVCPELMDHILPLLERTRDVLSLRILSFPKRAILNHPAMPNHLYFLHTLQLGCVLPTPDLYSSFANVTILQLQWSDYETYPTWAEFVTLILALPILRILTITDYEWNNFPVVVNTIALPYLESIELSLTKETCLHILEAFDLSTTSRVSITCKNYHISDPVIIPLHLSNPTSCSNLQIISSPSSISISAIFEQNNISQQFNITLVLINTKGEPERTWINDIIKTWRTTAPFNNAHSPQVLPIENSDEDDIEPIELEAGIA